VNGTPRQWAAALATGVAVVIGLVAAWIWPIVSIATVWPFLLVVPGWAIVAWGSRGRGRIPATGRLGLAIILSVAVSAHLSWWLASLTGGYGRETVFLAAALLALRALEDGLARLWEGRALDLRCCSVPTQLICLRSYLDDPRLAARAGHAWSALQRACHHHAYELAPTAGELEAWFVVVRELIGASSAPR